MTMPAMRTSVTKTSIIINTTSLSLLSMNEIQQFNFPLVFVVACSVVLSG